MGLRPHFYYDDPFFTPDQRRRQQHQLKQDQRERERWPACLPACLPLVGRYPRRSPSPTPVRQTTTVPPPPPSYVTLTHQVICPPSHTLEKRMWTYIHVNTSSYTGAPVYMCAEKYLSTSAEVHVVGTINTCVTRYSRPWCNQERVQ